MSGQRLLKPGNFLLTNSTEYRINNQTRITIFTRNSAYKFGKLCNKRYFKVRAELPRDYRIQARVYSNQGHVDYAYQLFKEGAPTLRWDNKEEFHTLNTYPHHHHDNRGNIRPSPLVGDPQADIVLVLREIEKFLAETD